MDVASVAAADPSDGKQNIEGIPDEVTSRSGPPVGLQRRNISADGSSREKQSAMIRIQ